MQSSCVHALHMPKAVQIRNVPEDLHRTLKARAVRSGRSLSEYLLAELRTIADRPSLPEMLERLHRRRPVRLDVSAAELIAEERAAR